MTEVESIHSEKSTGEFNTYKVGEKKSINDYVKIDAEDESLTKWKQSLGLPIDDKDLLPLEFAGDKRTVVVKKFELFDADTDQKLNEIIFPNYKSSIDLNTFLKDNYSSSGKKQIQIKEKTVFKIKITFKVQHELITGLKYKQAIKKAGISLDKVNNTIGSYAPNSITKPVYTMVLPEIEAPSGMLGRGNYSIVSTFTDDDKNEHLTLNWSVNICK